MNKYRKTADRRQEIIEAACDLAERSNYKDVRRHQLVEKCNTAAGNVSRVVGSMEQLRDDIVQFAIDNNRIAVIAQAIIDKHPSTLRLSPEVRQSALIAASL